MSVVSAVASNHHYGDPIERHYNHAVVVFDIQRHIHIDRREPTLRESKALYRCWFGAAGDDVAGQGVA